MTMTLPTPVNTHTQSHDADSLSRGINGSPNTNNTKGAGNLPITTNATGYTNNTASNPTGVLDVMHWELDATGLDVSSDTWVLVWTWQFNAPNRIQCSTVANDGIIFRIGSGAASPPTDYKHFQIAGNDRVGGSSRENPRMIVIDLNDTSNESSGGTFDNTDVETYGYGSTRFDIAGSSTNYQFFQRLWLFSTTKGSSDIPTFTGTSDWDDLVDLLNGTSFATKISDEWAKAEGNVRSIACPIQFGDNSTVTNFNDNGLFVFFPDSDTTADPRVRVTSQAFRVYANLRNNSGDGLTLSGRYDCGNSTPDWDFDLDFLSKIVMDGASFKNVGTFLMGSSCSGAITFDSCGVITINHNATVINGSSFKNPNSTHCLSIPL